MASLLTRRLREELEKDLEQGTIVWNELGTVNRAVYARRLGVTKQALPLSVFAAFDDLGPKAVPTEEKLRLMLEEDLQNGGVVLSRPGYINKRHYAQRAGCGNTQYYKELFEEFETKLGQGRTKDLLLDLLSQDLRGGVLKFSRGGKIDRTHYAKQLGVTKAALTPHIPIFQSFEEKLGGAKRYRNDDVRRMEEWLEAGLADGTLKRHPRGGMVRTQFKSAFNITHSDFETRFPEVGALMKRYDILIDQREEAVRKNEAMRARAKENQSSGNKTPSGMPKLDRARLRSSENSGHRDKTAGDPRIVVGGGKDKVIHPYAGIGSDECVRLRPVFGIKSIGGDTIFPLIDAAVTSDIASGQLRLASDGSIDRSFYLAQALVEVVGITENVFDRYTQDVEAYRKRHGAGIEAVANVMRPHFVLDSAVAEEHDTCSDAVMALQSVAGLKSNNPRETRVADDGAPTALSQVVRDKNIGVDGGDDLPNHSSEDWSGPLLVFFPQLERHQQYPPDSGFSRIVSILNEIILGPGLPRAADGGLSRSELQQILRISRSELPTYDHILVDYDIATRFTDSNQFGDRRGSTNTIPAHPLLVRHAKYLPSSAFGRVTAVLNAMVGGEGLPRASGGALDEVALARSLGISHRSLEAYQHIVHDYDIVDRAMDRIQAKPTPTFEKKKPGSETGAAVATIAAPIGIDLAKLSPCGGQIETAPTSTAATDYADSADETLQLARHAAVEHLSGGEPEKVDATAIAKQPTARAAAEVVARYPMLQKHQHYGLNNTRGQLVDILNNYLLASGIPRSRGGKIDRRGLAREFGFSTAAMNNYLEILRDYEEATGGLQSAHQAKLPDMRAWLNRSIANGTLEVRDDKVARTQFYRQFGLPSNSLVLLREPHIATLIEEYDQIVSSTGYLPNTVNAQVVLLKASLDADPAIFKTGLSYDRTALASRTGISIGRIQRSPFIEIIAEADRRLREQVEADELCQIFARRLFSFRALQDLWSKQFLIGIGNAFRRSFQSERKDAAKDAYNSLMEMLRFLGSSEEPSCGKVRTALLVSAQN